MTTAWRPPASETGSGTCMMRMQRSLCGGVGHAWLSGRRQEVMSGPHCPELQTLQANCFLSFLLREGRCLQSTVPGAPSVCLQWQPHPRYGAGTQEVLFLTPRARPSPSSASVTPQPLRSPPPPWSLSSLPIPATVTSASVGDVCHSPDRSTPFSMNAWLSLLRTPAGAEPSALRRNLVPSLLQLAHVY